MALAGTVSYTYDPLHRVSKADYGRHLIRYQYDNNGNRQFSITEQVFPWLMFIPGFVAKNGSIQGATTPVAIKSK